MLCYSIQQINIIADLRFIDLNEATRTFERVMESNVYILIKLITLLTPEERHRFFEEYKKVFSESLLWKWLVKPECYGVKNAIYQLIGCMCRSDQGIASVIDKV